MITREEIRYFYDRYKKNLKKEESITAELMNADNQEAWVERLNQKYHVMRQLYIENEALLNRYVRPFLEGGEELTEPVAQEFIDQIWQAFREGFEDSLTMMEVAEALEDYFREKGSLNYYIWDLSILGILYNGSSQIEEGRKGCEYFGKLAAFRDRYFEIRDFEVRKRIIYAFYNRPVLLTNFFLAEADELNFYLDQALDFYNDVKVRKLDGRKFDFDGLIEELNYDVLGNYVMSHDKDNSDRDTLERAEKILEIYYQTELQKNLDPFEMPDEIYCYYKRTLFLLGKLSCSEFLDDYSAYCRNSLENDTLECDEGFWHSRLFQVVTNHLPAILECLSKYGDEYEKTEELRNECVKAYIEVVSEFPRTGNSRFVNDIIRRNLYSFMETLTQMDAVSEVLINVLLNRDEITLIHSQMVAQIADRILGCIFDRKPELLVGLPGCQSTVDVLENRKQIESFVSQASRIFDIGKLKDADIVNKQSRQLTDTELERIYAHPQAGAEIADKIPLLQKFHDVIIGHHKAWNGLMGYPESFDNTKSEYRVLIELMHISDCLDAATDFIGRSYKRQKSLDECLMEFEQEQGSVYSPDIVDLLLNDRQLQADLRVLVKEGRINTYYEVFGIGLDNRTGGETDTEVSEEYVDEELELETEQLINFLHESNRENHDFVRAMVGHSLLTLYVDFRKGRYRVFHNGKTGLFDDLQSGEYRDFLNNVMRKKSFSDDFKKLKYQLTLSEISHALVRHDGIFECEMRMRMGEEFRWVRIQCLRIKEKNRIPKTMAVFFSDVHEKHCQAEQMENVLKEAYQSAMEANKAKSVFLSNMSHDIRTPMNGIMGMTQIALQHLDDRDRIQDCLEKIDESSKILLDLINEVLDMSYLESGKNSLHLENIQLTQLMNDLRLICQPGVEMYRHTLTMDVDSVEGDYVMADAIRLRQVFTNILSNSIKYTPEGGHISLKAEKMSQTDGFASYKFVIRDNGIGMSQEFQQRLFTPFAREENSLTISQHGTGLGLSIVKSMVTMMGGSIEVESRLGEGTVFSIVLTFAMADKGADQEKTQHFHKDFTGKRILLAEDNALNREIAKEFLQDMGIAIDQAVDGQEALDIFRNSRDGYYHMILMDMQMPQMDGCQATKAIRNLSGDYAADVPIIALTANIFQDDIDRAIQSGMNEHVTKPLDRNKLAEILEKWL